MRSHRWPRPSSRAPAARAISQKQWTAAELDLDSLDLDEELARLEQREIQPTTEFGRHREDSLSARRDTAENDEEPWSDSLFSESAADRAQAVEADQRETRAEPSKHSRTEPSFSLEPVDLDDEPHLPQLRLNDPLDMPRCTMIACRQPMTPDDDLPSIAPLRKRHERSESAERAEALQDLTDDPLQLDWQKRRSPWGRRFFWLVLILLGAARSPASTSPTISMNWPARTSTVRGSSNCARKSAAPCRPRSTSRKSKAATWWCAATRTSAAHW